MKIKARRFAPLTRGRMSRDLASLPRNSRRGIRSGSASTASVVNTPSDSRRRSKMGASGSLRGSSTLRRGMACFQTGLPRSNSTIDTFGASSASRSSWAVSCRIFPSSSSPLRAEEKRLSSPRRCERSSSSVARLRLSSNKRAFSRAMAAWLAKVVPTCMDSRL